MLRFLRLLAWMFITAGLVIAALGVAGYWLYRDAERPGPLDEARTIVIPPHTGIDAISQLLEDEGVVRQKLAFDLVARLSGRSSVLKPGEYEIPVATSAMQTLDILAAGKTVRHRLTIPEGLTSSEVIALVRNAPALDGDAGPVPADGELLPDTYVYSYGDARQELIERMQHGMAHLVAQLWHERRPDLPLAVPQDAVTLASIVEKETAREEERPHVAGVFINRLRLGMPLQADPTVLYALSPADARLERPLNHADLAVNSPYNTYAVKGLPPGPIANPGRSSIRAAVRPERTEDLYFVADGSGGHVFAKTLADQNRNIAQYRRSAALEPDALPPPLAPVAAPAPAATVQRPEPEKPHPVAGATTAALHRPAHPPTPAARRARCHTETGHDCLPQH